MRCGVAHCVPYTGRLGRCPRCDHELWRRHEDSLSRTLGLAVAAAVLYVVTNAVPILGLTVLGRKTSTALLGGAQHLWDDRRSAVATLVLFSVVAAVALQSSLRSRSYSASCASQRLVEQVPMISSFRAWSGQADLGPALTLSAGCRIPNEIISEFRKRDRESKVYGRLRCDRCKLHVCNPVSGHKEFPLARGAAKRAHIPSHPRRSQTPLARRNKMRTPSLTGLPGGRPAPKHARVPTPSDASIVYNASHHQSDTRD
jgi:hypothetical protein